MNAVGHRVPGLLTVAEVADQIRSGAYLSLAGEAALLRQLPVGNWIGGTIPYFMTDGGGCRDESRIFVHPIPVFDEPPLIRLYDAANLDRMCVNAPANGFSVVILPGLSQVHSDFARNAPLFEDMFMKPCIGWVSGVALERLGAETPMVFHGQTGRATSEHAIVMDVALPMTHMARVEIINPFRPAPGAAISFPEGGFSVGECLVDGRAMRFSDYLLSTGTDIRRPLVADYSGALVNVSLKAVEPTEGRVDFFAPVFPGVTYRFALPLDDYGATFRSLLPTLTQAPAFACNCILNYAAGGLEGQRIGIFTGPMTFGEIAYQLLNQTLVYMSIDPV